MSAAETYVTAAYLVVIGVVLFYVVIFSTKVARLEREVERFAAVDVASEVDSEEPDPEQDRVLAT